MDYRKGFVAPLLLVMIAIFIVVGGYAYTQKNPTYSWKTIKMENIVLEDPAYYDAGHLPPNSRAPVSFSFKYPPTWSVCRESFEGVEYILVSDDCISKDEPFTKPTNYFSVNRIVSLVVPHSEGEDTGWLSFYRQLFYPSKNIYLYSVGGSSDIQATLDKIASTFKFNP